MRLGAPWTSGTLGRAQLSTFSVLGRPWSPLIAGGRGEWNGQKRRRIERLQKCVTNLEAFDPLKARKRAPAVIELEAAIDKALSSAFGYGTPTYLRYNAAAVLDPSPILTNVTARAPVAPPN